MGPKRIAVSLAAASLLAAAGQAQAFDYWRVDFGYSASTSANFTDRNFATDRMMCADAACTGAGKIDDAGNGGVFSGGLGWNLKNNWRFDFSVTYRTGYELNQTFPDAFGIRADVTSASLMANLYKDFQLRSVKPYLGAAIGLAQNKVDTMQGSLGGFPIFTLPGGTKTSYAYALMAGFGVPLSGSMTLDVGYRYADLGELVTDEGQIGGIGIPVFYSGAIGNLKAHELTIGLRF